MIFDTKNINPNSYLGFGTWQLWGSGRVPVGIDTSDETFNTVEKTGGEKSHTLSISEIPKHYGHINTWNGTYSGMFLDLSKASTIFTNSNLDGGRGWSVQANNEIVPFSHSEGNDVAHNNLQPFITCYIWKRIS